MNHRIWLLTAALVLAASAADAQEASDPAAGLAAPVPVTPQPADPEPEPEPEPEEPPTDPLELNRIYEEALRNTQRGRNTAALEGFKRIAREDPYWSDAFYNVGSISEHVGHFQDCALYYRRYLILEPTDGDRDSIQRSITRCENAMGETGTLHVTATSPEHVRVVLDGIPMSEGELGPLPLTPGTHTISATLIDHYDSTQVVEVVAGETVSLTLTLQPQPFYGSVRFEVAQEGAEILIDGVSQGVSPLAEPIRLETGEYRVEVIKEGYHPWRRNIDILRDLDEVTDVRLIDESVDLSQFGR